MDLGTRATVLIVDPHPEPLIPCLQTVATVLTRPTAATGLAALTRHRPHVVVVEYLLPDGSGLDVIAHIRLEAPQVHTLMATASGSENVCASAFRLGAREYLIKPVVPAELLRAVRNLLGNAPASLPLPRTCSCPSPGSVPAPRSAHVAKIVQAARIIDAHYAEGLSLERLARIVSMNRFELSRQFTRVMGRSLRRYTTECRITHAQRLLTASGWSVTEIAQVVGFGDLPRFDKVFRRAVGCSPSEFRARASDELKAAELMEPNST